MGNAPEMVLGASLDQRWQPGQSLGGNVDCELLPEYPVHPDRVLSPFSWTI